MKKPARHSQQPISSQKYVGWAIMMCLFLFQDILGATIKVDTLQLRQDWITMNSIWSSISNKQSVTMEFGLG